MLTSILYHEISFPDLGISLNPSRGLDIGPVSIRWYGLIIAIGLCLAVFYACRRSKQFGLTDDTILDGVLWVTPFAIICARAYYCIFRWEEVFAANPISCLYIWEGGLAIYGGVIGAAIGIVVFCKIKKIRTTAVMDLIAIGFLIGQAIGRWGNFFNREAFGSETDSFLRMGLTDALGYTIYVHPTFLYESLWNLAGFVILHFTSKVRKYDGQIALMYLGWYGAGRAMIEGLRTDSLYIPGTDIRVSQLLSLVLCVAALIYLVIFAFDRHNPNHLYVAVVAKRKEDEAALLAALSEETTEIPETLPEEPAQEELIQEETEAPETPAPECAESTPEEPAQEKPESPAEQSPEEEAVQEELPDPADSDQLQAPEVAEQLTFWQKFDAWLRR